MTEISRAWALGASPQQGVAAVRRSAVAVVGCRAAPAPGAGAPVLPGRLAIGLPWSLCRCAAASGHVDHEGSPGAAVRGVAAATVVTLLMPESSGSYDTVGGFGI